MRTGRLSLPLTCRNRKTDPTPYLGSMVELNLMVEAWGTEDVSMGELTLQRLPCSIMGKGEMPSFSLTPCHI